jgi:hypothetical protein
MNETKASAPVVAGVKAHHNSEMRMVLAQLSTELNEASKRQRECIRIEKISGNVERGAFRRGASAGLLLAKRILDRRLNALNSESERPK